MKQLIKKAIANEFFVLCQTKPIKKITVTEIAKAADISKQTFYHYFKDKDDVLNYLFDLIALDPLFFDITKDNFVTIISNFYYKMFLNKFYYKVASNYETQNSIMKNFIEKTETFYKNYVLQKHGEDYLTKDILNAITFYSYGIVHLVKQWIDNDMNESTDEIAITCYYCMPQLLKDLL
ncbi:MULTISPECIES: TetR/AcrR family transcriptional regulator [Clostridium]|uniref:TetR/AcrR family transcriptional regulator n=1 Tax=Clostridium frigoriphilum TaxID=443253 RepID=A0ABU7USM6_9CLOT|nr:TetR/AcrR family transcriptional regulator [Clostridium sp. DSM 17811]MBU3101284.1 TetR/AcrR family transcriptional regulator [Clostridium sp. DSM 17811]